MANEHYRNERLSGEDRTVPDKPLLDYITLCTEGYADVYLDSERFLAMRIIEDEPDALKFFVGEEKYMSAVGVWVKLCSNWSNRGAREYSVVGLCDIPYVRC